MSELNLKFQENTLEKWAEKELGLENVKQIRDNPYINGDAKRVLDYIFENFYDPQFSKIIGLNLALDEGSKLDETKLSFNDEDLDFVALKIRYLELRKEKYDLEKKNSDKEQNTNVVIGSMMEKQSSKSSIDNFNFLKKNMELTLIEDDFEKKKNLKTKIDKANKKLYSLIDKPTIEYSEIDNLVHDFKFKHTKDCDSNDEKLNLLTLAEYFEFFDSKTSDDISKLNHILDGQALINEVDLIKYQNTNEFTLSNVQSLNDAINQELLNMIVLNSQSFQYETKKVENDKTYEMLLKNLKNNRISKYYRDYRNLYGRYFKSYITLKKVMCEFEQLNSIFEQLKSEKDFYRNSFLAITKRFDRIKSMELRIHEKQIDIEDVFNENLNFFNKKFQLDFDKIKISWDQLVDILRVFITSNSLMNSSRNDSTCQFNDSRLSKIELYKQNMDQLLNNDQNKQNDFDLRINLFGDLLKLKKAGKAKSFLVTFFSEIFHDIANKTKMIADINEQRTLSHDIEKSFGDLNILLNNCKETDKCQMTTFYDLMVEKIRACEQNSSLMLELKDLVSKWFNQPAAYECPLENYTVNSKNLDYYMGFMSELIKERS
ncbi:hypothetical protein BpHYR1_051382 [Brachionus plicatilis]|uniref:Uncharacterized protein n=1 Tax=Brachionus plicatilis TaxID=10195 RepID=A0A3M7PRN3_BRAPC|nr:hypothetical protein BpHYR1_051382 [Brachionus plicatilis]